MLLLVAELGQDGQDGRGQQDALQHVDHTVGSQHVHSPQGDPLRSQQDAPLWQSPECILGLAPTSALNVLLRPTLPATSSPLPWQHLLPWQNCSSLHTLIHEVSATQSPPEFAGTQERDLGCACSQMTPTRACLGSQHNSRSERGLTLAGHHQPLHWSIPVELTSSEIFTARIWFAMVSTRPLAMSFSTVS